MNALKRDKNVTIYPIKKQLQISNMHYFLGPIELNANEFWNAIAYINVYI